MKYQSFVGHDVTWCVCVTYLLLSKLFYYIRRIQGKYIGEKHSPDGLVTRKFLNNNLSNILVGETKRKDKLKLFSFYSEMV